MTVFFAVMTALFIAIAVTCAVFTVYLTIEIHRSIKEERQEKEEWCRRMNDFSRTVISGDGYRPARLPKTLTPDYIRKANADLEQMQWRNK